MINFEKTKKIFIINKEVAIIVVVIIIVAAMLKFIPRDPSIEPKLGCYLERNYQSDNDKELGKICLLDNSRYIYYSQNAKGQSISREWRAYSGMDNEGVFWAAVLYNFPHLSGELGDLDLIFHENFLGKPFFTIGDIDSEQYYFYEGD